MLQRVLYTIQTTEQVKKTMSELVTSKVMKPDKNLSGFCKRGEELCEPLVAVFNKLFDPGQLSAV